MKCMHCGTEFADGMMNCPSCGAPASPYGQPGMQGQPYAPGAGYASPNLTKKEFLKHPNLKTCKGGILSAAVFAYICAVISLIYNFFISGGGFTTLIDFAIMVGLGLGIQLAQSRACAIVLLVYSIINMIISIVILGQAGGYLILIVAIDAVIFTFRFQKAWKEYQSTGVIPVTK